MSATARPRQIKTDHGFQNPLSIFKPVLRIKQNNKCFWCGHSMTKTSILCLWKIRRKKRDD